MRLLIVDDNLEMRERLKWVFQRAGHEALCAESTEEACAIAKDKTKFVDFALVDYYVGNNRKGTGFLTSRALRAVNRRCIIFLYSALVDNLSIEKGSGVLECFAKEIGSAVEAEEFVNLIILRVSAALKQDVEELERIKRFDWDKRLFEYLVSKLGTGLDILSPDFRIIYCNERFREAVGLPVEWRPAPDDLCWKVYHNHQTLSQPCQGCAVKEVLETGTPCERVLANPVQGKICFYNVSAVPLFTDDGRIYAVAETISDETQRTLDRFLAYSASGTGWNLDGKLQELALRFFQLGVSDVHIYVYDQPQGIFYQRYPAPPQNPPEGWAFEVPLRDLELSLPEQRGVAARIAERYTEGQQQHVRALLCSEPSRLVGFLRGTLSRPEMSEDLQKELYSLAAKTLEQGLAQEEATARARAADAMRELDVQCAKAMTLRESFGYLIEIVVRHFGANLGHVRILNEFSKLALFAVAGEFQDCIVPEEEPSQKESAAARAYRDRKPVCVRHVAGDEIFRRMHHRLGQRGVPAERVAEFARTILSYVAVPILLRDREAPAEPKCCGTIYLGSSRYGFFTGDKVAALQDFANRAADLVYRLGEHDKAWREFSAHAAHRIGNEINAVGTLLDLLGPELEIHPESAVAWTKRIQVMQACILSAKRMLRDQTRLMAEITPERVLTFLKPLIESAVVGVLPDSSQLRIQEQQEGMTAPLDRELMSQVFRELATNSVRAGGNSVRITASISRISPQELATGRMGGFVQITFADNGPGIEASVFQKLFRPHISTRKEPEAGLGLFFARRVAQAHGGDILAEPTTLGAKFVLRLPTEIIV
jgi:signal transduction histidine kinase/PAS domain-containing protein